MTNVQPWAQRRLADTRHGEVWVQFDNAALPVVRLRMQPIRAVHPQASADRWRMAMAEAGLLTEIAETTDDKDPRSWIQAVQQLLQELSDLDIKGSSLRSKVVGPTFGDAPWWGWLFVMAEPVVAINIAKRSGGNEEDKLLVAMFVYVLPATLALALLVFGVVRLHRRRRAHLDALAELAQQRATVLKSLRTGIEAIMGRSFVARGPSQVLVCTAGQDWVKARARDARKTGRADLGQTLDAEAQRMQAALEYALRETPDQWTSSGLEPDREAWSRALAAAGVAC